MSKRRMVLFAALALAAALAAGGTLAAFTATSAAYNKITMGTIHITLNNALSADGAQAAVGTNADGSTTATLTDVMPGQTVSKEVSVTNSGTGAAWVRVQVKTEIIAADGDKLKVMVGTGTYDDQTDDVAKINFINTNEDGLWARLEIDPTPENAPNREVTQILEYFYSQPVAAGKTTALLLDSVTLDPRIGNEYQGCTVNITISAQAVQSANNGVVKGSIDRIFESISWPAA